MGSIYKNSFIEFVRSGISKRHFIGTGNPNASILMIGKESAIGPTDILGLEWYHRNAIDWNEHISNNTCETLEYPVLNDNHLYKNWGKNTWSKYQKLNYYIFPRDTKPYYVDFLKTMFTTELNDSPNKKTANAKKSSLNNRKELFKNSEFIQQFPVVILACSNYLKNNDFIREIDDIFQVTYDGDETGKYIFSKGNWLCIHHNQDKSKIVIHTRQLSANVDDELLKKMGEIINDHLIKTDLIMA